MSAGWWADRFTTWYHQRKAENLLRKYGICTKHFIDMELRLDGDAWGLHGWIYVCAECEKAEAEHKKNLDVTKIAKALETLLKAKKDVRGNTDVP